MDATALTDGTGCRAFEELHLHGKSISSAHPSMPAEALGKDSQSHPQDAMSHFRLQALLQRCCMGIWFAMALGSLGWFIAICSLLALQVLFLHTDTLSVDQRTGLA